MSRQGRVALAALSGLLLAAAFPPLDLGPLAWIALVPLLAAIRAVPPGAAFRLGLVAGLAAFVPIVAWMRVFSVLAWGLLAAYLAVFPAAFAALWRWVSAGRSPHVAVWAVPLLWTSLEYLRSLGVLGFPWALLGLTQSHFLPAVQVASVAGVFGVSFVVTLASAVVAQAVAGRRLGPLVLPLLAVAAAVVWGAGRLAAIPDGDRVVAALQPNIPTRLKFDPLYTAQHMDTLARLTARAGRAGAVLIVMPETAVPYDLFGPTGALREVGGWARRARATLIATAMEGHVANIAVAVAPSGDAVSRTDKVRLVAFGEHGVRPGARHQPLWTPQGWVGVAVCFESIFPDVARALARGGAEVLAVVTNDGWFDGTAGGAQHAAHAVLRAVETGRWVVRAANSGVTMIVDPSGRIRGRVPPRTEDVLTGTAAFRRAQTPYTRWGDRFAVSVLFAALAVALPRLGAALRRSTGTPAFAQSAAALGLPLLATWMLIGWQPEGIWPGVLLAFVVVLAALRPLRAWGFTARGLPAACAAALGAVAVLGGGLVLALRAYGLPAELTAPPGGWVAGGLRLLVVALAMEGWLRGVAFTPLAEWLGPAAAVTITTAAGMLLQRGLGAEALAWTMVSGAAFGAIRARTGNALGLVLPHAVGAAVFSILGAVR